MRNILSISVLKIHHLGFYFFMHTHVYDFKPVKLCLTLETPSSIFLTTNKLQNKVKTVWIFFKLTCVSVLFPFGNPKHHCEPLYNSLGIQSMLIAQKRQLDVAWGAEEGFSCSNIQLFVWRAKRLKTVSLFASVYHTLITNYFLLTQQCHKAHYPTPWVFAVENDRV